MNENYQVSWDDLMNLIDIAGKNNIKIQGDILNEELELRECVRTKIGFKRNFEDMNKLEKIEHGEIIKKGEADGVKLKYELSSNSNPNSKVYENITSNNVNFNIMKKFKSN